MAELFEADTLQPLRELELGPPCYTEDIAHQAENASFNLEYAYVATNALGSFSGGNNKEQIAAELDYESYKLDVQIAFPNSL